jgi:hypothetical protein
MKRLILLALVATSSFCGVQESTVFIYRNKLTWEHIDQVFLESMITCSNWTDGYRLISLEQFDEHDIAIFRSYDYKYAFLIEFNRETHECRIEFNGYDDNFDLENFKSVMQTVFLYD